MTHYTPPFEIHVHGDVRLRPDVGFDALQDALNSMKGAASRQERRQGEGGAGLGGMVQGRPKGEGRAAREGGEGG